MLQRELVRARTEARLFGTAAPPRLGRYVLLERLAAGGMGVVYGGHDPQLDRRVALKVVHPGAQRTADSQQRLLLEARALARLDHPNVVPVHDVLDVQGQVVVIMEWVEGKTLATWEQEGGHTWREVLHVYLAAGRGLAAAHALGLVHRDFKPANAMIGEDQRVRILDFGLARASSEAQTIRPREPSRFAELAQGAQGSEPERPALTASGGLLGTLAFMAPEQLRGASATALSDQFSFGVSLYRALFGVRPYPGESVDTLLASMAAGGPVEPVQAGAVPRWLRAAVRRALSFSAEQRYPSMSALLLDLERGHRWRASHTAVASVVAVVLIITAIALRPRAPLASCDRGAAEIARHWGPTQRDHLGAAIQRAGAQVPPSIADPVKGAVLRGLDTYAAQWSAAHREACVAHRDGAQSAQALDRRMTCLRQRQRALAAAVEALATLDRAELSRAQAVVADLPEIADCGDLDLLAAERSPPPRASTRPHVEALGAQLASALALDRLGRHREALEQVRQVHQAATALDYPPLLAEVLLAEGRILLWLEQLTQAREVLRQAQDLGMQHQPTPRAVEAAARRLYVEARLGGPDELSSLIGRAELLEQLSRPLRDGFARPLLLNNLGVLHMARGDRAHAKAAFEQARLALGARAANPELTAIDRNLAMLEDDAESRARLTLNVWERRLALLGSANVLTLEAQLSHGWYLEDPAKSLEVVAQACGQYRALQPSAVTLCSDYLAFLRFELGDLAGAKGAYLEVARAAGAKGDRLRLLLAEGQAALCGDDAAAARAARAFFEEALALAPIGDGLRDKARAQAHLGLGLSWRAFTAPGQLATAMQHLEQAIVKHERLASVNASPEHRRRLALAQATLALLLRRAGTTPERVAALEASAAAFFRRAGASAYRHRLALLPP